MPQSHLFVNTGIRIKLEYLRSTEPDLEPSLETLSTEEEIELVVVGTRSKPKYSCDLV